MKYFIDMEFIEGFHQPKFLGIPIGKKRHFIDLISIGIVCEDGRKYYAVSNEFNSKDADEWVYDNVLMSIQIAWIHSYNGDERPKMLRALTGSGRNGSIKMMQNSIGKSNKQIAEEIKMFVYQDGVFNNEKIEPKQENIEFYAYYADYDWVLFCSLFGRMIDLPKGFPMYCKDLKQTLDEKVMEQAIGVNNALTNGVYPIPEGHLKPINKQFEEMLKMYKEAPEYPKQTDEHNALADAKWNYELYKFIEKI